MRQKIYYNYKILNNFFNKTLLGETGCLSNPYFLLTDCLGIQFFDSFHFPNTVS